MAALREEDVMAHFGRVVTAMATPFTQDGALDLDGVQRLAAHLVDTGTDTVLVNGTTGESPTLSHDEVASAFAAVRDAVGDRAKVMLGTGTNDTAKSCAATAEAVEAGADAVLVVTPYYNRPSQGGLIRHFTQVAAAAGDVPMLVYDVPARTAREIELATLIELSQVPNIVGVKDAVADLGKTAEIVAQTDDAFDVYCGADEVNLASLAVGAAGYVSVASHVVGQDLADMAQVFDNDPAKAREINARLMPIVRALFLEPSPAPLKAILNDIGLPAGPVRPPLADASPATLEALRAALAVARGDRPAS